MNHTIVISGLPPCPVPSESGCLGTASYNHNPHLGLAVLGATLVGLSGMSGPDSLDIALFGKDTVDQITTELRQVVLSGHRDINERVAEVKAFQQELEEWESELQVYLLDHLPTMIANHSRSLDDAKASLKETFSSVFPPPTCDDPEVLKLILNDGLEQFTKEHIETLIGDTLVHALVNHAGRMDSDLMHSDITTADGSKSYKVSAMRNILSNRISDRRLDVEVRREAKEDTVQTQCDKEADVELGDPEAAMSEGMKRHLHSNSKETKDPGYVGLRRSSDQESLKEALQQATSRRG